MSSPAPGSSNQKRSTEDGLVTLSPTKRQKKDERHAHDDDVQPRSQSVPEHIALPLRLTTLGGYLPLKDAGRFLLRVSKVMTAYVVEERVSLDENGGADADDESVTDLEAEALRRRQAKIREQVWRCLCEQKWRNRNALKHLMSTLGGQSGSDTTMDGWERLFRKFLPSQPKPPVRASVEDYSFIFTLYEAIHGESERGVTIPLTSLILKGNKAATFLRTGKTGWLKLDEPVKLPGNYACKEELLRTIENGDENDDPLVGMESTMHAIRQSDGKSCELNRTEFRIDDEYDYRDHEKEGFGITYCSQQMYDDNTELGNLNNVVNTSSTGLSIFADLLFYRKLRTTISEGHDGTVQHAITHVAFCTMIYTEIETLIFPEQEQYFRESTTVADLLEHLNAEWK